MLSREDKLKKLKSVEAIKSMQIITNGGAFIDVLEATIDSFKDSLNAGIEVDAYDLIEELKEIRTFIPAIKELVDSIDSIELPKIPEIPSSIEVKGLNETQERFTKQIELLKKISELKLPDLSVHVEAINKKNSDKLIKRVDELAKTNHKTGLLNEKSINKIVEKLENVIQVVNDNSPQEQSQDVGDFTPVRRVRMIGNRLVFDDSAWTGGGSGGGTVIPLNKAGTKVPVEITDPITATIDESTLATAAKQDTAQTTLSSIDTKTPARGTANIAASSPVNIASDQVVPVSATSLPLPTGAATSANQSTSNTTLSTIATNTGNSATSANQTNGNQQAKITNGTNVADVIANDSGYNGVSSNNSAKTITFTTSASGAQQIAANTDCRGYASIKVFYTSVGTGLALSGQFAPNSGGTYTSATTWINRGSATGTPTGLATTVNTNYQSPIVNNFFQINVTALTSGTFSGYIVLSNEPVEYHAINVGSKTNNNAAPGSANVGSLIAVATAADQLWTEGNQVLASTDLAGYTRVRGAPTGSAVPANAFYIAGLNSGGNLAGFKDNTAGDGPTTGLFAQLPYVYNGSGNDRTRSATAASNTTGTGLLGVGNLVFDGTNWQALSSSISDATGATGAANIKQVVFNGTNFDRQRNNTTGVVIAAGATTSNAGVTTTTYNASKLLLAINITAGAGTLTVAINGNTSSGYTYPILTSTALTGVADNTLRVFPGATAAANTVANDILPRTFTVVTTVVGSVTYGIDYVLSV